MIDLDYRPLAFVPVFLAAVVAAQAAARAVFRAYDGAGRIKKRLEVVAIDIGPAGPPTSVLLKAVGRRPGDSIIDPLVRDFDMLVSRTGLSISPKRLVRITGLAATAMWLIFTIFTGAYWGGSPVVALMSLGGFVALASIGLLQWLRATVDTRRKRLERQLPGAMDVIARGLRAGYPVVAAIALAASELEAPLGPELALIVDATTYGADFKDSLKTFAVRSNSDAVGFFATAVGIQSETGGNLGELLEELSVIMKSRSTLRMKVSALASEGKATAWMLSALPFALVAFQMAMNPRFYLDKVGDPIFWPAVIVMGMLFTVGWILMNKIINFKY